MRFFTSFRMTNMAFPSLRHSLPGGGEIFGRICLINYGFLGNCFYFLIRPSSFMITSYSTIFFFTRAKDSSGPMNSVLKPF